MRLEPSAAQEKQPSIPLLGRQLGLLGGSRGLRLGQLLGHLVLRPLLLGLLGLGRSRTILSRLHSVAGEGARERLLRRLDARTLILDLLARGRGRLVGGGLGIRLRRNLLSSVPCRGVREEELIVLLFRATPSEAGGG